MDDVCTCQDVRLAVRVAFSVLHKQLQLEFASFWEVDRAFKLEGDVRKHSLFAGAGQCPDKPRSNMGGGGVRCRFLDSLNVDFVRLTRDATNGSLW